MSANDLSPKVTLRNFFKEISSIVFWTFATFDMSIHACKNLKGMPGLTCILFFFSFCGRVRKIDMCISHKIKFFPHLLKIVEKGVCEAGFLVVERSRAVVRKSIMSSHFYGCLLVLKIDFFVAGIRPRRFSIGPCRTILQPKFWA